MKRTASIALTLAILTGLLASCGGDTPAVDTTGSTEQTTAEAAETRDSLPPDLNFGGEVINILCRTSDMVEWANELYVAEDDGDIVNSAVYARNRTVEERLNVKLNYIEMDGQWNVMTDFMNAVKNSVNAGDQAYDLVASYRHYMPQLATEGYFYNLHNVPHLDFDKPWWKSNFTSELTLDGKLHFMAGDIGNSMLKGLLVMFYNKELAEEWELPDIYSLVTSGNWTIDKAIEICTKVSADLNGDNQMTWKEDLFSLCTNHCQEYFDVLGSPFTKMNADGIPELAFNNEKSVSIVEKLNRLFYETGALPYNISASGTVSIDDALGMFKSNRLLIWAHCLGYAESMRDMEADFTVIPYFKWDSAQKDYVTAAQNNFSIFSIPVNCGKIEAVGAVTEALAVEGYYSVTPAYYEKALGTKYMRDEQAKEMLEIIRNGVTFNFGTIYSIQLDNIYNTMPGMIASNSNDFASYYAAREENWNKLLGDIVTAYREMEQ